MADKNVKRKKRYNSQRDAHQLNRVQIGTTIIGALLYGNYLWQATKYANPRFANDVEYKKKQLKKKFNATVDHILGRCSDVEDVED